MVERKAGLTEEVLKYLGAEVRRRRQAAGLTLQSFAETSGLSRRMLNSIELGQANPSLLTVGKLADAFEIELVSLLRPHGGGAGIVNSSGLSTGDWRSPQGSYATLAVVGSARPPVEVWDWTLVPGDTYTAEPDPEGSEEMILVVEGILSLKVGDSLLTRLSPGASARLDSDRAYAYKNEGSAKVRFVRIARPAV